MPAVLRAASFRRAGPLVPRRGRGLRAGSVRLPPGGVMDWHSTRAREELLLGLRGIVRLEMERRGRIRRRTIRAGSCILLPRQTRHRVVNRSPAPAHYLYVTAPGA